MILWFLNHTEGALKLSASSNAYLNVRGLGENAKQVSYSRVPEDALKCKALVSGIFKLGS